jgi:type VI secretion system VasD/TssJ family lipoprotein
MRVLAGHRAPLRAVVLALTLRLSLTLTLALGGCSAVNGMLGGSSAADALADTKWRFAQRAIEVRWQADNALNSEDGKPHALLVAVLQMADADAFRAASVTPARLAQWLAAPVAPPGFLSVERVFVQPGQTASVSLARVDHARFVGVIAGYYGLGGGIDNRVSGMSKDSGGVDALDPARVARVYEIGVAVKSRGLLVKHRSASIEPLVIDLRLGSGGIIAAAQSAQSAQPIQPTQPTQPAQSTEAAQ